MKELPWERDLRLGIESSKRGEVAPMEAKWIEQPGEDDEPTLRDQFAMAALTGMLADPNVKGEALAIATRTFEIADAMLKARKAKP